MDIQKTQQYNTQSLLQDLRQIIEQARGQVAATANYELTMMYWHIGERINREVLGNQRAEYGKQIVATVSRQLQEEYGKKGFDEITPSRGTATPNPKVFSCGKSTIG